MEISALHRTLDRNFCDRSELGTGLAFVVVRVSTLKGSVMAFSGMFSGMIWGTFGGIFHGHAWSMELLMEWSMECPIE